MADGWILYDASCGFCSRWALFWGPTLRRIGLEVAPLQAPWAADRLARSGPDILRDLLLLRNDGTELRGAEVYRYIMRRIWWARPLYLLVCAPLLSHIFDRAYRAFADHRHTISRACAIEPPRAP